MHIAYCCLITFVIGISCYLSGCNPNYDDQCFNYNVISGVSNGFVIKENTCKKCVTKFKANCVNYEYFSCWDTKIKINYGNNQTCYYNIVSDTPDEDYAKSKGSNYQVNKNKKLIKKYDSSQCIDFKTAMDFWITGVFFLSLWFILILLLLIESICVCMKNKKLNIVAIDISTNESNV